jgi:hypothetical protein
MKNLAHAGFPWDRNTNPGQALEQLDVVEEGSTEPLGALGFSERM